MNEVETLLTHSFDEIKRGRLIVELLRLSQKYLELPATDCEKEHLKYYQSLQKIKLKPMEKVKSNLLDKKYILRGSTLLYYNSTHFNNDTLTDNIAGNAIKKFPNLIGIFLTEKEKNVLRAKAGATVAIAEAENAVTDEAIEKKVNDLIEAGDLEGARDEAAKLADEGSRILTLETLDAAIIAGANEASIKKEAVVEEPVEETEQAEEVVEEVKTEAPAKPKIAAKKAGTK